VGRRASRAQDGSYVPQALVNRRYLWPHLGNWAERAASDIALNRFIWHRGRLRWLAHWLILWGCAVAVAITFPLVFGWLSFESVPDAIERYRVVVFGFSTFSFAVDSVLAFLMFHGLVWSAFLVIAGVMIAMRRRMRDEGAAAVQQFAEDFLPLIMLFAVSITGLMLTVSYTWMKGYAYDFLTLQLWLFTATANAALGGDSTILWPAALASLICLGLNVGLLRYLYALER
jgi:hypothetical protein